MATSSYLDKIVRSLPSVQGKQILRLLIAKKDSGEIKTLDEFKDKLKQLTTSLLAQQLKPTLKLWPAIIGQDTSSEQYNDMLRKIADDLEAGFAEANNLDEIVEAHHQLINSVSLKAIRWGINKIESQVALYEFLQKNKQGFDNALFDTFRISENLTSNRSVASSSQLFYDPHLIESLSTTYDCIVDVVGERLMMGTEKQSYIQPRSAKFGAGVNSTRSEFDVTFANSDINHIIDGKTNTYWAVANLFGNIQASVKTVVELELPTFRDLNFIEVEPVGYYPLRLVSIQYYGANQTLQSALTPNTLLYGPGRFNFNRITTSRLVLTFSQENADEVQFKKRVGEQNFYKAVLAGNTPRPDLSTAKQDLQNTISSSFLLNEIFSPPPDFSEQKKYYEYIVGFDNIRVGMSNFLDRSIYVSKKRTIQNPGVIALKVDEHRPVQALGSNAINLNQFLYPARTSTEDDNFYHGSVEYWLLAQSYTENNFLIATDYLPVLPLGANRIYHERLHFTNKTSSGYLNNNAGTLIHYTSGGGAGAADILVYRNSTRLKYLTDWEFYDTLSQTDPEGSSRMKRGIKLISEPNSLDIYTVSYTPVVSTTFIQPSNTDLLGMVSLTEGAHIRVGTDNIIIVEGTRDSYVVDHMDLYLIVLMRRNSANTNVAPTLEEYMLVTGTKTQDKFVKDF